jgi:hypothetical protein
MFTHCDLLGWFNGMDLELEKRRYEIKLLLAVVITAAGKLEL